LICCAFFVSRCAMDSVWFKVSSCVASCTISMQFPVKLHVIPKSLIFDLAKVSVLFTLFVICVLSYQSLERVSGDTSAGSHASTSCVIALNKGIHGRPGVEQ
jgi:hypothetical protein